MRRRLIQLGLFLLLGAIVNVAVAWGIAYVGRPQQSDHPRECKYFEYSHRGYDWFAIHTSGSAWQFVVTHVVNANDHAYVSWLSGLKQEYAYTPANRIEVLPIWSFRPESSPQPEVHHFRSAAACGWPTISLGMSFRQRNPYRVGSSLDAFDAIPLESRVNVLYIRPSAALPLKPLWPGFAINTVFYAAILWVMFAAPFALRRRRRVKRGLCPACAYPVGESDVCTECGGNVWVKTHLDSSSNE